MKRITVATIIIMALAFISFAWAQEPTASAPKPKTIEELSWQAQALQNEFLYLQERVKNIQTDYAKVIQELQARKAAGTKVEQQSIVPKEDKKEKK